MLKNLFIIKISVCLLSVWTVGFSAVQEAVPDTGTAAQREAGQKSYSKYCSGCHGDDGAGQGSAAGYVRPVPRDFTSGSFKIRSTPSGEMPTTEDLIKITKEGMPFTSMPALTSLKLDEIKNLAYYMKTFDDYFSDPASYVNTIDIDAPPPITPVSISKGRKIYLKNGCQSCHGDYARGEGLSAATQRDAYGKLLRPTDLSRRWTFKGGSSQKDIYKTIFTGMDGTPMASYGSLMSKGDLWNIVNYIYSLSADKPGYASSIIAVPFHGELELENGRALFYNAKPALIPVVGQVIETGRCFFPAVHSLEVRAVYSKTEIAIMLTWHDISPQREGKNSPALEVEEFDPDAELIPDEISDAVAVQFPSTAPDGFKMPYFLFGDSVRSVDIWFADLAAKSGVIYTGKGSGNIDSTEEKLPVYSEYKDGRWTVIFKQLRVLKKELEFEENGEVPVAFSVWDGLSKERGNTRGITTWYYLHLEKFNADSPWKAALKYFLLIIILEIIFIFVINKFGTNYPKTK